MNSFAYYRLPYSDTYTKVTSSRSPLVVADVNDVGKQAGFFIAPFHSDSSMPKVLILPDCITTVQLGGDHPVTDNTPTLPCDTLPDEAYQKAFKRFHSAITDGQFTKLVLARSKETAPRPLSHEQLFLHLCHRYPRLMIMLFSTPLTGTWVIASPEILVEGTGNACHTIALAGTMPYNDGYATWTEKNKREQHIVEQYIEDIITPLSQQVVKDGPYTSRAGNLQHLRTDFRFHLSPGITIGNVIAHLHPTPAVCGLPAEEAMGFILSHEGIQRKYYSGFAGPVGIDDETHLFVSLRCAELHGSTATLYAGGGIMPDSSCLSEWQETESKIQTIDHVLK